jgi:2-methylisocitrate lyase-like PEP mutase family enzyme
MPSIADKRREFRRLHQSGCFVIPNPWDIGTTRYLQSLGFKALATTSAGFAFSRGLPDGAVTGDATLAQIAEIAAAADVPVNADFEGGYAHAPDGVAESVRLCVETGMAGLSIEDWTGDKARPLYDFDLAVARVRAARAAIDKAGGKVVFTARSEGFIRERPDLDETIRRLKAYSQAGADCLYAPGLSTREEVSAVVEAVAPKPVNVLMGGPSALTVHDLERLGARRISIGGALSRAAWGGFMRAAREIAEAGSFNAFGDAAPGGELKKFFSNDMKRRTV